MQMISRIPDAPAQADIQEPVRKLSFDTTVTSPQAGNALPRYAYEELMEPQQEIISTSLSQRCRFIELEAYPLPSALYFCQSRSSFRLGYENNGSMDPNSLLKEGIIQRNCRIP
jgi:hypothetical protein